MTRDSFWLSASKQLPAGCPRLSYSFIVSCFRAGPTTWEVWAVSPAHRGSSLVAFFPPSAMDRVSYGNNLITGCVCSPDWHELRRMSTASQTWCNLCFLNTFERFSSHSRSTLRDSSRETEQVFTIKGSVHVALMMLCQMAWSQLPAVL